MDASAFPGGICRLLAATVHLSAAVANLSYVECWETPDEDMARQESPIFVKKVELKEAVYIVPDGPGLGVEIDEAELSRAGGFRFSEMPHLQRRDGSVTNW
ncbi:enolase-like protein [Rhizobium sp. BK376]|nr:enolase-like protein [Rhizobium sp. BK376]